MEELEKKEKKAKDERDGKVKDKDKKDEKKALEENPFPEDADDIAADISEEEKEKEEEEDDEDEDTEELMRELAKIKREREAEEEARKAAQAKQDERARKEEILLGNPLLAATGDLSLKRKWDDDTVFKNQSRTAPKAKPRYINDAVRSDFHKKFLNKYVWVDGTAH